MMRVVLLFSNVFSVGRSLLLTREGSATAPSVLIMSARIRLVSFVVLDVKWFSFELDVVMSGFTDELLWFLVFWSFDLTTAKRSIEGIDFLFFLVWFVGDVALLLVDVVVSLLVLGCIGFGFVNLVMLGLLKVTSCRILVVVVFCVVLNLIRFGISILWVWDARSLFTANFWLVERLAEIGLVS